MTHPPNGFAVALVPLRDQIRTELDWIGFALRQEDRRRLTEGVEGVEEEDSTSTSTFTNVFLLVTVTSLQFTW